jgi:predicted nucleic acid-binding protein
VIAPFDSMARAIGELCGRARTNDVVDAHVALTAIEFGGTLYTSDPADIERLFQYCRGRKPTLVRC